MTPRAIKHKLTPLAEIKEFGRLVGKTDSAFARMAIRMCEFAAAGEINSENPGKFLVAFHDARCKARGEAKLGTPPHKVQVSKLKRIVVLGEEFGDEGTAMLRRALALYVGKLGRNPNIYVRGTYNALVEVARAAVNRGDILSDREIAKLLLKKSL